MPRRVSILRDPRYVNQLNRAGIDVIARLQAVAARQEAYHRDLLRRLAKLDRSGRDDERRA